MGINICRLIICILVCFCFFDAKGQTDAESRLEQARRAAAAKQYEQSRAIASQVLLEHPQYYDAQVFIGRTLAWQGMYDSSRVVLVEFLTSFPKHFDALGAITDLELWAGNPLKSVEYAQSGIEYYPEKDIFYLKKFSAYMQLKWYEQAEETLLLLLRMDPAHAKALQLRESIRIYTYRNATEANYMYSFMAAPTPDWHWVNLQQTRRINKHLISLGLNYAYRFNMPAVQYDFNAYPVLSDYTYAYFNVSYSQGLIFPLLKSGAELFRTLGKNNEASLGLRYFNFRESKSTIVTGSISQAYHSYLLTLRPYFTFSDQMVAPAGSIMIKKYLKDNKFNFLALSINYGFIPDNPAQYAVVVQNVLPSADAYLLQSAAIRIDLQHDLYKLLKIKGLISFEREEFLQSRFRNRVSTGLGLIYLY